MRDTMIFHRDWYDSIKEHSDDVRLACLDAIFKYAFEGVVPTDKFVRACTKLIMTHIDNYSTKYEKIIEKRREAGRKGAMTTNQLRWGNQQKSAQSANDENCQQKSAKSAKVSKIGITDTDTDTVTDTDTDTVPTNVGDKEKTSKEVQKKTATRFIKPTVEEVEAYCRERGNYVDAEQFCDFYESKGWKVGSNTMKDWRAAVRTWEKKDGRTRKVAPKGVTIGVGEWIDERGVRRYGSGLTAPMNAPARPDASSYWSAESNRWVTGV